MTEIVGYIAGILTTVSFLPQVIKTLKTRDTSGISLLMYCIYISGVILWGIYGVMLGKLEIIIPNIVTVMLSSVVLYLKVKAVRKIKI